MTEPKKKPQPPRSILDPDFQYVPACRTDIRQTFARVRERMAQRVVVPMPKAPVQRR